MIEYESDENTKAKLQQTLDTLETQQQSFGTTFEDVQKDLNIENPKSVEDVISNSSSFLEGILGAQAAATVGAMAAVAALTLGGSKSKRNVKKTSKKGKKTKKHSKK